MPLIAPPFGRAPRIAAFVMSLFTAGCLGGTQVPTGPTGPRVEGPITPQDVRDDDFAMNLHRVLRDGSNSPERLGLLVGVVRRQLAHAGQRFAAGHEARGTASVIGALYLVRAGEGRKEMIDKEGERALAGAIERVSPRGDEGRALALMKMRAAALDPASPARAELDQHLAALEVWMKETRTGGPMKRLGAEERAKVARALIDPSDEALEDAAQAIDAWIAQAIRYNDEFQQTRKRPERDEAIEASRALQSGGATLAALFLRHGDAAGAIKHIDGSAAKRVVLPALYARLRAAAVNDGGRARDWQALAGAFAHRNEDPDEADPETDIDPEVLNAALWGSALEAYRRDPTSFDSSLLVGRSLVDLGMPEAAPIVVSEALAAHPTPPTVTAAMELLLAAIGSSAEIEDLDAARRTYRAAAEVLAQADRPELRGRIDPSAARARFVMASIEMHAGNLTAARPLLKAAVGAEPSVGAYTMLALLERQAGDPAAALEAVQQALRAPDARMVLLDVAEAHLLAFELLRESASPATAKAPLDAALAAALAGRGNAGNTSSRARAERILGRVLEAYGETKGAKRAFERALKLASSDAPTLGAVMLDAIGRALVRRDLVTAREALRQGLDGGAGEDDLVYGGLWVALLERELRAQADGTVERALSTKGKTSWTAKLTAWAGGKLSDTDLSTAAKNTSQRVEAAFYTAMARKAAGDPAAEQRLRAVAASPVIDLLEVHLAREMLAPRLRADLPGGVQLP